MILVHPTIRLLVWAFFRHIFCRELFRYYLQDFSKNSLRNLFSSSNKIFCKGFFFQKLLLRFHHKYLLGCLWRSLQNVFRYSTRGFPNVLPEMNRQLLKNSLTKFNKNPWRIVSRNPLLNSWENLWNLVEDIFELKLN